MATWGFLIVAVLLCGFLMLLVDDRGEGKSDKKRSERTEMAGDDPKPAK